MNKIFMNLKSKFNNFDKLRKSQGGFALITIVILVFLFLLLGTSLAMLSVGNFRQAYKLKSANKAFYISDGAIEESLNDINDMVLASEKYANYVVTEAYDFDDETMTIYDADEEELENTFLGTDDWQAFIHKLDDLQKDGRLTEEVTTKYLEYGLRCEFLKRYYQNLIYGPFDSADYDQHQKPSSIYPQNAYVDTELAYTLMDGDELKAISDDDIDDDVEITDEDFFESCIEFQSKTANALNNTYKNTLDDINIHELVDDVSGYKEHDKAISIESEFSKDDGLEITMKTNGQFSRFKKKLELKLRIIEPQYAYVIRSIKSSNKPCNNEVRNYALISGKYILNNGGKLVAGGDVYAYGVFGDGTENPQKDKNAGIVLGLNKDRCTNGGFLDGVPQDLVDLFFSVETDIITFGNLITRSDILIYSENSLYIKKRSPDLTGGDLIACEIKNLKGDNNINSAVVGSERNVYIMEDIEIRGDNPFTMRVGNKFQINNTGSLFLILSSYANSSASSSDHAASLIVKESIADDVKIDVNHLFISGVAFSSLYRNVMATPVGGGLPYIRKTNYMTGESTNVEDRYIDFYKPTSPYNSGLGAYNSERYGTEVDQNDPNTPKKMKNGPVLIENLNEYGIDDVNLKTDIFMNNARRFENGVYTSSGVDDKYKDMITIHSIDVDTANEQDQLEENFALGVLLAKGGSGSSTQDGQVFNPNYSMAYNDYMQLLKDNVLATYYNAADVDRKINFLATRDFNNNKNMIYDFIDNTGADVTDIGTPYEVTNRTRLSQLIDFSDENNIIKKDDPNNICIINNDDNVDIFINPPSSVDTSSGIVIDSDDHYKGLIATTGNIYFYAGNNLDIHFDGLMAAEGHVILYGNGQKHIDQNEMEVIRQMQENKEAWDALYANEGRKIINLFGGLSSGAGMDDVQDGFDIDRIIDDSAGAYVNEMYSITEGKTPVILTVPDRTKVGLNITTSPPLLEGTQKGKEIKGYEILEWKEIR